MVLFLHLCIKLCEDEIKGDLLRRKGLEMNKCGDSVILRVAIRCPCQKVQHYSNTRQRKELF